MILINTSAYNKRLLIDYRPPWPPYYLSANPNTNPNPNPKP